MKIAEIKLSILERPGGGEHRLVEVPGLRRIQYTHKGFPTSRIGVPSVSHCPHR